MQTRSQTEVGTLEQSMNFPNASSAYKLHLLTADRLQSEAWSAYNLAFHAPEREEYRQAGRELYHRVLSERIRALYLRGDEQNSILDTRVNH